VLEVGERSRVWSPKRLPALDTAGGLRKIKRRKQNERQRQSASFGQHRKAGIIRALCTHHLHRKRQSIMGRHEAEA
jgi:hypothetical protein